MIAHYKPILLLFAIITTTNAMEQMDHEKIMQKLTACWILQVQEVSAHQKELNAIIDYQIQQGNTNRTAIFYKIQCDMVSSCFEGVNYEESSEIIQAIQDDTKQHKSFRDIVSSFNYDDYNSNKEFTWQFDDEELRLLRFFKDFEVWVSQFEQKKKESPQPSKLNVLNDLKSKLLELANQKNTSPPDQETLNRRAKTQFVQQKSSDMKSQFNYVLAALVVTGFVSAFFYAYKQIQSMQTATQKKKK